MEVFVVSKNTGPTWSGPDPIHMVYIGTSLEKAIESVGDFAKYEENRGRTDEFPEVWSALPRETEREMVKFYMADGWWYSIVKIQLSEPSGLHQVHIHLDRAECSCGWVKVTQIGDSPRWARIHTLDNTPAIIRDMRNKETV